MAAGAHTEEGREVSSRCTRKIHRIPGKRLPEILENSINQITA